MNLSRTRLARILVWSAAAVLSLAAVWFVKNARQRELDRLYPNRQRIRDELVDWNNTERSRLADLIATNGETTMPRQRTNRPLVLRAADMNANEKAALADLFSQNLKPALADWFAAYENRIPFALNEVTLDSFHSAVIGSGMYTFMIGDTTLTLIAPKATSQKAKVGYLMGRQAALELNQSPTNGFVPNMNVPVSRADIIRMVKSDSGVAFSPNEILIQPTAMSCALNGGVFVNVLPAGLDPKNFLNYRISMVFDANGKLVNYERDPQF